MKRVLPSLALLALVVLAWQGIASLHSVDDLTLASPIETWQALKDDRKKCIEAVRHDRVRPNAHMTMRPFAFLDRHHVRRGLHHIGCHSINPGSVPPRYGNIAVCSSPKVPRAASAAFHVSSPGMQANRLPRRSASVRRLSTP